MAEGLRKRDLRLLDQALLSLPPELAYLREAISRFAEVHAAPEAWDLIGSGEMDSTELDRAWREERHRTGNAVSAQEHSERLKIWLEEQDDREALHLQPIWVVIGYLAGLGLYGGEDQAGPVLHQVQPARDGLRKVVFTAPPGMKSTLHPGSIVLRDREVDLSVVEVEKELESTYLDTSGWDRLGQGPWANPHTLDEIDRSFRIGELSGARLLVRNRKTNLPVTANYVFSLPCAVLEVQITARKQKGFDLSRYEPSIGSIRCRDGVAGTGNAGLN